MMDALAKNPTKGAFASLLWRAICGVVFGAGMSSLANAAIIEPPHFGPEAVHIFGFPVPIMSGLFGLIGVMLARRIAPIDPATARLGPIGNAALTALLALGVLALVIAGERRPIVSLCWAIGLGYSGVAFIALVAQTVRQAAKIFLETFVRNAGVGGDASDQEKP